MSDDTRSDTYAELAAVGVGADPHAGSVRVLTKLRTEMNGIPLQI